MSLKDSSLYDGASVLGKTGAVIGTALNPAMGIPLLAGAFGGDKLVKNNVIKSPIKPVKQARELLAADLKNMRTDPNKLGLSDATQEKMRADAVQTASAQNQAQSQQLAQSALAGQGFQQGAFRSAQQDLGESAADAGVKAGQQIHALHNQIVETRKADIMQRLEAERERVKENTRFWMNFGIQGIGAIIGTAMGNPTALTGLMGGMGSGSRDLSAPEAPAAAPATSQSLSSGMGYGGTSPSFDFGMTP